MRSGELNVKQDKKDGNICSRNRQNDSMDNLFHILFLPDTFEEGFENKLPYYSVLYHFMFQTIGLHFSFVYLRAFKNRQRNDQFSSALKPNTS